MMTFEEAMTEVGPTLARIAASYERDRSLREDLLQDILLALYRALPSLSDRGKLKSFAARIAHNRSVDHVVRRVGSGGAQEISDDLPSGEVSAEEKLVAGERSQRVLEAVRALELPYRQVMTLVLEDMSYTEIADALGITLANVGVRVNRAKSKMKAMLDND
jgi:RNA polymerase sigma-70 factor (ECF subfamily)